MKTGKTILEEFWAVTTTSLYHARIGGEGNAPVITKIGLRERCGSRVKVGGTLAGGTMLAVCRKLVLFIPEGGGITSYQRELVLVNYQYWGGQTSNIVGLFRNKETADECFRSRDIKPIDARWKKETIETLRAIGTDHPRCSISTKFIDPSDEYNPLIEAKEWQ